MNNTDSNSIRKHLITVLHFIMYDVNLQKSNRRLYDNYKKKECEILEELYPDARPEDRRGLLFDEFDDIAEQRGFSDEFEDDDYIPYNEDDIMESMFPNAETDEDLHEEISDFINKD